MSVLRYCGFYKAKNDKWYLDLADDEYGSYEDANTIGPFYAEAGVEKYLNQFANAGGCDISRSGNEEVPTVSPNGFPIEKPIFSKNFFR